MRFILFAGGLLCAWFGRSEPVLFWGGLAAAGFALILWSIGSRRRGRDGSLDLDSGADGGGDGGGGD